MRWTEISLDCDPDAIDAVSYAMIQAGCGGVMITGTSPVKIQGTVPFSDEFIPRIEALKAHLAQFPEWGLPPVTSGITLKIVVDTDWANEWKKYFKPLKIGNRLVIVPSWEEYSATPDELIIELDPGMAFGTGGHPTTCLCMEALEMVVRPGFKVADIGTGSGILSIAAARLGATEVFATDIDTLATRIARENIVINKLTDTVHILETAEFEPLAVDCDLGVANILAHTIIDLAPSMSARIKPGGLFIGSGIVEEKEQDVIDALFAEGIEVYQVLREDIWVCLLGRKILDK